MNCRECNGMIMLDRTFSTERRVEMSCICCGKMWMIHTLGNAFGMWILRQEKKFRMKQNGS